MFSYAEHFAKILDIRCTRNLTRMCTVEHLHAISDME